MEIRCSQSRNSGSNPLSKIYLRESKFLDSLRNDPYLMRFARNTQKHSRECLDYLLALQKDNALKRYESIIEETKLILSEGASYLIAPLLFDVTGLSILEKKTFLQEEGSLKKSYIAIFHKGQYLNAGLDDDLSKPVRCPHTSIETGILSLPKFPERNIRLNMILDWASSSFSNHECF